MPIYEYKGQQYEMAETDPAAAKARILSYLGETAAPPVVQAPAPAAPTVAPPAPAPAAGIASLTPPTPTPTPTAATPAQESQFFSEFGRGAKRAVVADLPSLFEQASVVKDIGALTTVQQRLNLFDRIEKGEINSLDQLRGLDMTTGQGRMYLSSSPEVRQKLRERAFNEIANRRDFVDASIKAVKAYQQEAKKYAPLVEKASDIGSLPDFANWLGSNMGSGAVQMAPMILAAAATGGVGLVGMSAVMGVGESVGERLKFIEQQTKTLPPEQKAEAIIKYLQDTGDVTLLTGVVSGLLDAALGPEAAFVKKAAADLVKAKTRTEAVKQAAKKVPGQVGGEAVTGGAQQGVQIAGGVKLKEKPEFFTKENLIDILNAAAGEAAGATVGAGLPVGIAALRTPEGAPKPLPIQERVEPTFEEAPPAPAPAPAPAAASDALLAALGVAPVTAPAEQRLTPGAPTPLSPEELEAKIAQYAQFMPEEDARRTVMDEQRAASEAAEAKAAVPAPAPAAPPQLDETTQRLKDLTQERIDAGIPPQQAALQALEQLQKEAQADTEAAAAQGEQRVAEPVTTPSGEGAGVAGVTPAGTATEGVGGTERTGVVSPTPDAGQPAGREGQQPGAVADTFEKSTTDASGETAAFKETDGPWRFTQRSVGQVVTFTDSGKTHTGTITAVEQVDRQSKGGPTEILKVTDSDPTSGRDDSGNPIPEQWTLGNTAIQNVEAASTAKPTAPKPAGKRGRKPLPPEQQAKSEERRKEQRRQANAADREVTRLEAELAEAKKPVEPGDYPNETEYAEGKISQGMRRKRILAALHDFSRTNKNKPGQRAKAILEAEATAQEIADIAKGYDLRKEAARKISPSQKNESRAPDPVNDKLKTVKTGAQAIGVLLRTGTLFQKFMAARIRNAVAKIDIVVLEKGDPLPSQLSTPMAKSYWDTARALYIYSDAEGKGTVYLRGESFGNDQGVNNVTVLHELLHAATAQKIQLALRLIEKGVDMDSPAVKAVLDLRETMRAAADEFIRLNNAGRIPKDLADLYITSKGAIFTDVREFVSYGLTDVGFQKFLNRVTDVVEPSETFFSRFVDAIRKLFGVPEGMHTAMTNLVLATDKVIASRKSDRMKSLEAQDARLAKIAGEKQRISAQDRRTLDEIDKEVDEALLKFQKSKTAEEAAENLGLLHSLRKWDDTKQYFKSLYDTVDAGRLSTLLSVMPTDVVADWGSSYVPEMKNTNNLLVDMRNMQYQLVTGASEVSESMTRAITKDPSLFDKLARVMSVATDVRVDPENDSRNQILNNLYIALGADGQRIYKEVRDYYARMVQLYTSLLDAQIADANLPPDAKNKLMAQIRKKFETDKKIVPYFPFVRNRGTHWLRVKRARGEAAEFYMLGSIAERDAVAAAIAKEMNRPVDELYKDEVFKGGDTVDSLRRKSDTLDLSDGIKGIFTEIDNLASLSAKSKDQIKDSVYELYLMALPDQTFRKGFIERKDVAGYSTDVVRAFSTSALRFANQLPRIKYSQKLRNSILAGRESLKGNPDAAKLDRFVNEMEGRISAELNPEIRRGTWESAVDFITRLAFIHYLSSAGSAILQGVGMLYGASTLGARHGYAQTALEMGKMMRVFGEYSIIKRNADGSVSIKPPTVALSKRVTTNPMEQRAIREVFGAVTEHTISSEVLGRGRVSTAKFEGRGSMIGRGFSTVVGGLFHTTERLVRETIFMTSFRLSLKEGQKKGLKGDDLFNYAKQQAIADVYDSVGNMREENRPPVFRNATGRFLLQFLHYPLFITIRWMQEFKRMLPFMGNEAKFQAFKEFAGIMGTTYILGGVVALPFIKEMAGFIAAAFDDFDDEDKPADMRSMSYWTWWSNVWLPEYLGKIGVFGKSLEEVTGMDKEKLAAFITRGPTNVLTGRDISSRVSINPTDMLLGGPTKETRTTRESAIELALERAGPAANMVLSYMDAYDAWQNGDMQKTMEKLLPAVARNVAVAEKYRKEGVKDFKGNTLIDRDSFTRGDYLYQLIGLRPDDLANHQKVLFEMSRGENKIRFERERIIRNARDAALKGDTKRVQQAVEEQNKFNRRYPENEITQENIDRSIDMSVDELTESFKGFRPTEKNERIFAPTAIASGRALAESREKKAEE